MKLTPWFSPIAKPHRRGLYERDISGIGIRYSFWNGKYWGGFALYRDHAIGNKRFPSCYQNEKWRGLASKPKSKKGRP